MTVKNIIDSEKKSFVFPINIHKNLTFINFFKKKALNILRPYPNKQSIIVGD